MNPPKNNDQAFENFRDWLGPYLETLSRVDETLRGGSGTIGLVAQVAQIGAKQDACAASLKELKEAQDSMSTKVGSLEVALHTHISSTDSQPPKSPPAGPIEDPSWARTRDKLFLPILASVITALVTAGIAVIITNSVK